MNWTSGTVVYHCTCMYAQCSRGARAWRGQEQKRVSIAGLKAISICLSLQQHCRWRRHMEAERCCCHCCQRNNSVLLVRFLSPRHPIPGVTRAVCVHGPPSVSSPLIEDRERGRERGERWRWRYTACRRPSLRGCNISTIRWYVRTYLGRTWPHFLSSSLLSSLWHSAQRTAHSAARYGIYISAWMNVVVDEWVWGYYYIHVCICIRKNCLVV